MERRLSLLFEIIGGLLLTQLNGQLGLSMCLGSTRGYLTDWIFGILSDVGLITIICFCIILIIDTVIDVKYKIKLNIYKIKISAP